ncbi:MAG: TolC family protein [Gammaproteobacteria bacterium]|nr:TolC family protein [Gammaproteobacteria bacterium]
MFLTKYLMASMLACLVVPVWAATVSGDKATPLSIGAHGSQKVPQPLQTFIQQVWSESPAVQGAQAAIDAARARVEGAGRPIYNPSLALDAERTDINTTSIGFSQTLDWSDKREAQTRIADQEVLAATAALWQTRQRIAVEALAALNRYFTAQEMQALALRRSQLMKGFIDTVTQRQAAGDMNALDGTLAQVTYSEALMQQAASESELAEAEAALQAVSGFSSDVALAHWPQLPSELAPPPEQVDFTLLQSLPALAILRSRMEAARARIRLAERVGSADPTIGIRAGRDGSENLLGLNLEIPLFVRNNFKAEVLTASHEAVGEELVYRDAHRRAKARLGGSLGRFQNTTRAWRVWLATGQQAQREQMSLLEQLWQASELTATDFLIQAKQNIDTQAAATALKGEVWQAAIVWLDASGQVGRWLGFAPAKAAQTKHSGE